MSHKVPLRSQDSLISIVTELQAGRLGNRGSIPPHAARSLSFLIVSHLALGPMMVLNFNFRKLSHGNTSLENLMPVTYFKRIE